MTRCIYNSKRLIPAPKVSFSKDYIRTSDGTKIGSIWNITINGIITADAGSPDSNGIFWTSGGYPPFETISNDSRLGSIFRKQEAIRDLFSEDGYLLEFQSADGTPPVKCVPRITSINLPEDIWYNTSNYTIQCEADVLYMNGTLLGEDNFDDFISDASETWTIDTDDNRLEAPGARTYVLTHNVSATGRRVFDETGSLFSGLLSYNWAQRWVRKKIGIDSQIVYSGTNNIPDYFGGYNHVLNENIDEFSGSYGITESWILASGKATEEFTISTRNSITTGLTNVNVEGTITGLEQRDSNFNIITSKYDNANTKFNNVSGLIFNRAQTYSNINLNYIPLNTTVGVNPFVGTISYNYEYDNRPSNLIANAKSESIVIQDNNNEDVIAIIPIPGRAAGPIIQDIYTKQEKSRALTIEAVMTIPSGTIADRLAAKPDVSSLSDSIKPTGLIVKQVENSESWDINSGRFSLNRRWVYE